MKLVRKQLNTMANFIKGRALTFADLPDPRLYPDAVFVVLNASGVPLVSGVILWAISLLPVKLPRQFHVARKPAGCYISDGERYYLLDLKLHI